MSAEETPDQTLAEPAADPVAEEAPVPKRRSRAGWALLALAVVAGLGFAAAWFDVLKLKGEDKVPALQAQLDEAGIRLKATEEGLAALAGRVAAVEAEPQAPAVAPEVIDGLAARVGEVEAALEALSKAPALTDGSIPAASFAALAASVDALKGEVSAMKAAPASGEAVSAAVDQAMADWTQAQAAEAEAEVEKAKAVAVRIDAVQTLRAAALSGAPYGDALAALGDVPVDALIRDRAETGLPTLTAVTDGFPEAARAALEASLRATGADDLSGRLYNFLRIQTGARSLEAREGDDPDAVLSRAEAAVKAGDVAAALTELATLPAEGQAEMAEWSAQAKDYIAAQDALAALAAAVGL